MKLMNVLFKVLVPTIVLGLPFFAAANGNPNQTPDVSPIFPNSNLPFTVQIEQADFSLPNGIHSGVSATYQGKWIFLAGRTNGMHTFNDDPNNFPPQKQNQTVYVVDPHKKSVVSRSLTDSGSGLTQAQIDQLSVTSPQFYQKGTTLYITGGYGVDTDTGEFSTKNVLTAIDLPGLVDWVLNQSEHTNLARHIRQVSDEMFRVTGGYMAQSGIRPTLLIFGQNFPGYYFFPNENGYYTQQVRRFYILDTGTYLSFIPVNYNPADQDPSYRRRDLNVLPTVRRGKNGFLVAGYVALSGVFTLDTGIWTVPVEINVKGKASMADPSLSSTFKQGMNNYVCATFGMFSSKTDEMYNVLLGGISYGFFENGSFQTSEEFPFINQVTTVKSDKYGDYEQYLMDGEYPVILSTGSNPGNPLLFGAGAQFMLADDVKTYSNQVIRLDKLDQPKVVGYIVGGIQSTLPNTNVASDSSASAYIFKVSVLPVE